MMQQAIFDGANYSSISTEVDGTIRSFLKMHFNIAVTWLA